jgi:hypothetical protein
MAHDNRHRHRRGVVIAVALTALSLTAGCAGRGTERARFVAGSPSGSAASVSGGATPTGAPRATTAALTAACKLLSAAELKQLLGGGGSQTKVTATEDKPDTSSVGTTYTCIYGSNGKNPFALSVSDDAVGSYTPIGGIDAIGKAAKVKTEDVPDVGDAAVFYSLPDGTSILAAAIESRGRLHTVVFAAPAIVPKQKFVEVQKFVLDRI